MIDWLKMLYEWVGVPYPRASLALAAIIGATIVGGAWWVIGMRVQKDFLLRNAMAQGESKTAKAPPAAGSPANVNLNAPVHGTVIINQGQTGGQSAGTINNYGASKADILEIKDLQRKILETNKSLTTLTTNINDPRMADAGKVVASVTVQDGPIIDIGNPNALGKNRILIEVKHPDQILFHLYDSEGKPYTLHGRLASVATPIQVTGIWSSRDRFIAILGDDKILSQIELPELKFFQDTRQERDYLIGHSFEGNHASGTIRGVQFFISKELASR